MKKKATVLNCPINLYNADEALEEVRCALNEKRNFHIITINPEMIMNAQKNKDFFHIVNNSDMNIIDSVGVKIALKLKGINQNQIRGVDFARLLVKEAAQKNLKIAFIGAKEEVIKKTCENFLKQYPSLNIVYSRNGYFNNDEDIIEEIKQKAPDIVLVGLGSPRQEEFITKLKTQLQGAAMVGIGGAFDVFSGLIKEAPKIYQKLGLEWLYRTILQPERFKRIFPVLPLFLMKCIISNIAKKG